MPLILKSWTWAAGEVKTGIWQAATVQAIEGDVRILRAVMASSSVRFFAGVLCLGALWVTPLAETPRVAVGWHGNQLLYKDTPIEKMRQDYENSKTIIFSIDGF